MGFRDTAPDAPWRTRRDTTIAAQHARARALARFGGTSSQSTHVIPAHAAILEGALIRSRRRRQSAVKEARHRQPGYQLQSPRPLPLVQDPPVPRYAGAQQERQHSAAAGGTRDRLPPARGSIAASRRVAINFAFVISSQWCACRCTACAYSLSEFFLQRMTWPRKQRRQRRPPRQPPRRLQRKLPRKSSNRIHDGQIAASGSQPGRKATPLQRI